jgi:hypothetical protein
LRRESRSGKRILCAAMRTGSFSDWTIDGFACKTQAVFNFPYLTLCTPDPHLWEQLATLQPAQRNPSPAHLNIIGICDTHTSTLSVPPIPWIFTSPDARRSPIKESIPSILLSAALGPELPEASILLLSRAYEPHRTGPRSHLPKTKFPRPPQ